MSLEIPTFITHYHLADRQPFLTLSEIKGSRDEAIFENLKNRHRSDPSYKRRYGRSYLTTRRRIESKLRQLFVARGGEPRRKYPFYFVLGQSSWFHGLVREHLEIKIALSSLDPQTTSFTFPDSYVALSSNEKPYHGQVFLLPDLESVVGKYGMPKDERVSDYQSYWKGDFEKYIEFQIWEDQIVQPFIAEYRLRSS